MSECFSKKYIINNKTMSCENFRDNLIHEGKSLYEVIRIIDGIPLFLEDHLERLFYSAAVTGLNIWLNEEDIKVSIGELSKINLIENGNVKIVFNFNKNGKNTFLAYFIKHTYPSEEMYLNGVKTSSYHAERENPNAKVINTSLREITNNIIKEKNVYEVILIDNDGNVTEGSRSNVFMVEGSKVYTAPKEDVLIGITRKYVFQACKNLKYEIIERKVGFNNIINVNGIFMCGTSPKVLPISKVDNIEFDSNNKIVQDIRREYDSIVEHYINSYK